MKRMSSLDEKRVCRGGGWRLGVGSDTGRVGTWVWQSASFPYNDFITHASEYLEGESYVRTPTSFAVNASLNTRSALCLQMRQKSARNWALFASGDSFTGPSIHGSPSLSSSSEGSPGTSSAVLRGVFERSRSIPPLYSSSNGAWMGHKDRGFYHLCLDSVIDSSIFGWRCLQLWVRLRRRQRMYVDLYHPRSVAPPG